MTVPVVALARFSNGSLIDRARIATQVDAACREYGFFVIVDHGLGETEARHAWEIGQEFFRLPIEQRMSVAMPYPGYPYGYAPIAGERLASSLGNPTPPDLKETFSIGPVDPPSRPLELMTDPDEFAVYSPNQWPAALPEMRHAWETYYRSNALLAELLMEVFAVALDLPPRFFAPFIDRHGSAMRMAHYPPLGDAPAVGQMRAGAHTDYGTLTILRVDDEPGLEIQNCDGSWSKVQPVRDGLIVNIGDLMERWTNDRWRSTMHRVAAGDVAPTAERWSIPFFHNANWDAAIATLPSCLAPGEATRYAPVTAGAHLMSKFRSTVVGL